MRIKKGRLFNVAVAAVLAVGCTGAAQAQPFCLTCPTDATGPAIAGAMDVYVNRSGVLVKVTGGVIGACESPILRSQVSYNPNGTGGTIGAGYTAGTGEYILFKRN